MNIAKVDTSQTEFTGEELDAMVDILTKAKEIEGDKSLFKLVKKHMKEKTKKYTSVADLRAKANEDPGDHEYR